MTRLRAPLSVLMSYHYFPRDWKQDLVADVAAAGGAVIGDSGAFSAMTRGSVIDLDDYARWVSELQGSLVWAASLDVIGDAAKSWRNWQQLRRMGVETVPTVHYGSDPTELDRYAAEGAMFVGLGGVAKRKDREAVLRWLVAMMRYARDHHPAMRFHGWGMGGRVYLDHLPFFSTDSSGFGSGYRYGRALVFDPDTGLMRQVHLDGHTPGKIGRLLRTVYGIEPREVAVSHAGTRDAVQRLSLISCQLMEDYYRARHQVSPPPSQAHRESGVHIHFADSADNTFARVARYLREDGSHDHAGAAVGRDGLHDGDGLGE